MGQTKYKQENRKQENDKLIQEIDKIKKEADEYKNKYLRALADYQNLEKRVHEHRAKFMQTANLDLISELLPFLDNLEKAEIFVKDEGLKIAKGQLAQTLKEAGLEEIEFLGKPFDPVYGEAIEVVPGDKDDTVVEVLRKGYKFGERILRPAQAKVSKKSEARNPKPETNSNI